MRGVIRTNQSKPMRRITYLRIITLIINFEFSFWCICSLIGDDEKWESIWRDSICKYFHEICFGDLSSRGYIKSAFYNR